MGEEKEEEEEPRSSKQDGMSPQERPESPGIEDVVVTGLSGSSSQPDGELPALMRAAEDSLPTISSNERQQILSNEEQLPHLIRGCRERSGGKPREGQRGCL